MPRPRHLELVKRGVNSAPAAAWPAGEVALVTHFTRGHFRRDELAHSRPLDQAAQQRET
jgi:hypothetical protein